LNKSLVSYFKKNGIITLKKHVDVNHVLIAKHIEEVNKNMTSPMKINNLKEKAYSKCECNF
jgi:hypothetical protein